MPVKHPDRTQRFTTSAGTAFVFYPRADEQECTAALLLEVEPVALARAHRGQDTGLDHYVDDGPHVAGSLLAVALSKVFKTAMNGRCEARPEQAASLIPLRVRVPSVPCRAADLPHRLFGPLGRQVDATPIPLDCDGLPAHYVLDGGGLVVAHAGLPERYHGRASGAVRSFALYGDTFRATDEYGLPVRHPWATEYRGNALVLYGHTPTFEARWSGPVGARGTPRASVRPIAGTAAVRCGSPRSRCGRRQARCATRRRACGPAL